MSLLDYRKLFENLFKKIESELTLILLSDSEICSDLLSRNIELGEGGFLYHCGYRIKNFLDFYCEFPIVYSMRYEDSISRLTANLIEDIPKLPDKEKKLLINTNSYSNKNTVKVLSVININIKNLECETEFYRVTYKIIYGIRIDGKLETHEKYKTFYRRAELIKFLYENTDNC